MSGSPRALPAVVWDMGGVMYRYFTEVLLDDAAARGVDLDVTPLGPTGPVVDVDYALMDAGEIDEGEYLARVRRRLAATGVAVDPVAAIDWSRQRRTVTWNLIEAIHDSSRPQGMLTNDASKWLGERWWETWPGIHLFDAVIDVVQLGVRKPAPGPYLAAAEALELPPEACLFVDDLRVNCEGAQAVGMASHHVDIRDPEGAIASLAARLGVGGTGGDALPARDRSTIAGP